MQKIILFTVCTLFFLPWLTQGQELEKEQDSIVVGEAVLDSLYREDQFYVGFGFNLLSGKPKGISQTGFSGGLHLGFIRDMPINKRRNMAIGVGLGWSVNSYGLNLLISEDKNKQSTFKVLDDRSAYDSSRFNTYLVEAPIQFRWRTSTASDYKFWRIYTGFRLGYIYHFRSNYRAPGEQIIQTKVDGLNRFRYGATFTFGYNTFNFHVYYSLNTLFDGKLIDSGRSVGMTTFKIGLMFYIL